MLLILEAVSDPLDRIDDDQFWKIIKDHDQQVLSIDSFSEKWLIEAAFEEFISTNSSTIIFYGKEYAEINNLQSIIIKLSHLEKIALGQYGFSHPLIEKFGNFSGIELIRLKNTTELEGFLKMK